MDDIVSITTEEKKARIAALVDLLNHPGWKILVGELSADIALTEAKLFGEAALGAGETVEGLRRERIDRLELRDLPKNLIEEYAEDEPEDVTQEVYD
jgi:hypothetical protein